MGVLAKALSRPSSYSAKKTDVWSEVSDRIAGAMFQTDLDEVERWLAANPMIWPAAWDEPVLELIEKRREELAAEDVGAIVRDRYDF
jgi:hypothetical protein